MRAIESQQLHPVAMESDAALPDGTVLDSSLRKVRDAAAYVGVIGHRYGQIPECDENPRRLSLTELEFREARRLGRPILIFIMGQDHLVKCTSVEGDPEKMRKLEAFQEEVKRASEDSSIHRVYRVFNDLADFSTAAAQSVAELRRHLDAAPDVAVQKNEGVPVAPDLFAQPRYIGSHTFVGREAQLATLSDWSSPADQHTVLLFEAIGGTGKSMLTWEWTTRHASGVRGDWAGKFWYSFYEKGAVMADFCRSALAYMTGCPLLTFANSKQVELSELLLQQLESKPWLLVLDGLERVLVAYHRHDAAQLLDEEAGGSDQIANRDPCAAIRPEDDDLLWRLAGASPSKVLITSRLVPRALLNSASQAVPGVLHERLPGLRPADAEALLRSCDVTGDSATMRAFLQRHCDCHPLVTGIVAGLINDYLPARGDFDNWAADPDHGGHLDIGELDLVQKRNHILHAALAALSEPSRQLLSTVALLSEAVDYEILSAFNPHLPSETSSAASRELARTVTDLERRGLLQYDRQSKHYDLHPVVRAVAASGLRAEDRETLGQRVIDQFSARAHQPYEQVKSLDDLRDRLTVVRTLLQMGRMQAACNAYTGALAETLSYKLDASTEILSLLRPFFTRRWISSSAKVSTYDAGYLINDMAGALADIDEIDQSISLLENFLEFHPQRGYITGTVVTLSNLACGLKRQNFEAVADVCIKLSLNMAELIDSPPATYISQKWAFIHLATSGQVIAAKKMWQSLDLNLPWDPDKNRHGEAQLSYAIFRFDQGMLTQGELTRIELLGREYGNRNVIRGALQLRGRWLMQRGEWVHAARNLAEAVRMTRAVGLNDRLTETQLTLARLHLGELPDPRQETQRLAAGRHPEHLVLAQLWQEIGDSDQAKQHALAAYKHAWADGEPYVRRYDLERAAQLLADLGVEIPTLPSYDPTKHPKRPWEHKIEALIAELRAAKQ